MRKKALFVLFLAISLLLPSLALAGGSSMAIRVSSKRMLIDKPVVNKLLMAFDIETYFPDKQTYPEIDEEIHKIDFQKLKMYCMGFYVIKNAYLYQGNKLIASDVAQYLANGETIVYWPNLNLHLENNQKYHFSIKFDSMSKFGTKDAITCEIPAFNEMRGDIDDVNHPTFWSPEYQHIIGSAYLFFDSATKSKVYARMK